MCFVVSIIFYVSIGLVPSFNIDKNCIDLLMYIVCYASLFQKIFFISTTIAQWIGPNLESQAQNLFQLLVFCTKSVIVLRKGRKLTKRGRV